MFHGPAERFERFGVIPVIALHDTDAADDLATALVHGGVPVAEVTFRTDGADTVIRAMAKRSDILVGAGTVRTVAQAELARDCGAAFIVTPGFSPAVVDWAIDHSVPIFPGVDSTVAMEMGLERGLTCLKFFPAVASGGITKLRALAGPYPELRFMPTGGVNATNLAEWLAVPSVVACGGSWFVQRDLLENRQWDRVAGLAREAAAIVATARNH